MISKILPPPQVKCSVTLFLVTVLVLTLFPGTPVAGRPSRDFSRAVAASSPLPDSLRLVAHQLRLSGALALFDFDGTIISEQYPAPDGRLRSGQSTWHLWGARHLQEYPRLFPQHRLRFDHEEDARLLAAKDDLLEGLTDIESHGYMKFSQIACLEAGMTPKEVQTGLEGFFQDYPPADYAYPVMMNFIETLLKQGTRVWIISGSNPYFIHATLKHLVRQRGEASENIFRHGSLVQDEYSPFNPKTGTGCRIIGNMARLGKDQRFRAIYDDRFTPASGTTRFIVEKAGKWLAFQAFIAPRDQGLIGLVAGNSDGDFELIQAALQGNANTRALLVNPRGKNLATLPGHRCITISEQGRTGGESGMKQIIGIARNAKLGPLVETRDGQVWILGLTAWPPEAINRQVQVAGTPVERCDLPVFVHTTTGPISQGIPVEPGTDLQKAARRQCLESVTWSVVEQIPVME